MKCFHLKMMILLLTSLHVIACSEASDPDGTHGELESGEGAPQYGKADANDDDASAEDEKSPSDDSSPTSQCVPIQESCDNPETPSNPACGNPNGLNSSGEDVCAVAGWYCDGMCDEFCFAPDPDCGLAECPDANESSVHYVSTERNICETTDWACDPDQIVFDDDCGCGCIDSPDDDCPDPQDPDVHYISTERSICEAVDYACDADQVTFDDRCGCGCIDLSDDNCPDPQDPDVHYISTDRSICVAVDYACDFDQVMFDDECGCGCVDL